MEDRRLVSIKKACELVGVSRRTIYNWLDLGKVEWVRTAGGAIRVYVDSLTRPGVDLHGADEPSQTDRRQGTSVTRGDVDGKDAQGRREERQQVREPEDRLLT